MLSLAVSATEFADLREDPLPQHRKGGGAAARSVALVELRMVFDERTALQRKGKMGPVRR